MNILVLENLSGFGDHFLHGLSSYSDTINYRKLDLVADITPLQLAQVDIILLAFRPSLQRNRGLLSALLSNGADAGIVFLFNEGDDVQFKRLREQGVSAFIPVESEAELGYRVLSSVMTDSRTLTRARRVAA